MDDGTPQTVWYGTCQITTWKRRDGFWMTRIDRMDPKLEADWVVEGISGNTYDRLFAYEDAKIWIDDNE